MRTVTAKQLKQNTGAILRKVRAGESLILTYRGKAIATIQPAAERPGQTVVKSFEDAWLDIEQTLTVTEPRFSDWREAARWIRTRD